MKTIAIPAQFLNADGEVRANLTEIELAELAQYGNQPLTEAEELQRAADAAEFEASRLAALPSFLTQLRRKRVIEGFEYMGGVHLYTDAESIANLTVMRIMAKEDPNYTVKYKIDGAFHTFDAVTVIGAADAARAFVQKCFEAESVVLEEIHSGAHTSEAEIEAAFDTQMASQP